MGDKEKEINFIYVNLRQLFKHICSSLPQDLASKSYAKVVFSLNTDFSKEKQITPSDPDESSVCRGIEAHLSSLNRQNDLPKFRQLHNRLRRRELDSVVTNRATILSFLLKLSELQNNKKETDCKIPNYSWANHRNKNYSLSSISSNVDASNEHRFISSCAESGLSFNKALTSTQRSSTVVEFGHIRKKLLKENAEPKDLKEKHGISRCYSSDGLSRISEPSQRKSTIYDTSLVSEEEIVKELLYCFQGIPGKTVKLDHNNGFMLDPQANVLYPDLVLKLMELGYLHNSLINKSKLLLKSGAVVRAIEAAIRKILMQYYGMIASLQSEFVNDPSSTGNYHSLTICDLTLKVSESFNTLKTLNDVLHVIQNTKGGAALTALYPLLYFGDPKYSNVVQEVVDNAERPLLKMITSWMVSGHLYDPFDEFFISLNSECHDRDIWRNKFILRSALIPKVISDNQASMILRSGKAIKFLSVICEENIPVVGMREKLGKMKDAQVSDLRNPRSELTDIIAAVHDETSKLVLDTLVNKFKLFQHFQGLRRYMLLGQGDFANYFMDLVEPQMRKPASKLQHHELMSLLGTAIRGSNAAYEDPDVIKRVSVKILVASGGDWGSDVFGLQYLMHDTLEAALRISDGAYSQVFNFLWRTKRMESILLRLRKKRWATKNQLSSLAETFPAVNSVIMCADKLNLEFLHFARQFHYYILFEVVECLWEKFLQEYKEARSFDDVIKAHDNFIKLIQCKTFHQDESREFINQFRLIWDLVYELEALEERFFLRVIQECDYYLEREQRLEKFGTNQIEEAEHLGKKRIFKSFLDSVRAQYDIINRNYQANLKKLLLALSSENNHELTILSERIDFNDYYKSRDSRISDSMKYNFHNELFA